MTLSNTLSAAGRRSFLRRMSFGVTGAALGTLWQRLHSVSGNDTAPWHTPHCSPFRMACMPATLGTPKSVIGWERRWAGGGVAASGPDRGKGSGW